MSRSAEFGTLALAGLLSLPAAAWAASEPEIAAAESVTLVADDAAPSKTGGYGLGRAVTPEEVAAWDHDVRADGLGLPEGQGDVETGEQLFADNCAMCHGDFGEGVDRWPVLAGGQGSLKSDRPDKTIGSYWPYLSTVYDYVHRAMPFTAPRSLSDDDTYAIVAYLLYLNDIVEDDFVLSRESFTQVVMPNEPNFAMDDRADGELKEFTREPCMENCKPEVKITGTAAVLDVTPEDAEARKARALARGETPVETAAGAPAGLSLDGGGAAPATEPAPTPVAQADSAPAAEPAPPAAAAPDPALVAAGEKVFKKCAACHQVGEGAANKVGPVLNGVVGRAAGAYPGFAYSKPMQTAAADGLVWTEDKIAEFLSNPKGFLKGTKMSFAGLKKQEEIDAVTAFLASHGS